MTMEERLEKLECELARTKRGNRSMLAVMAVMAVALVWMATRATPDAFGRVSKVIRANEFWLVDENGKPRAYLSTDKDGAGLTLLDENGKTRAALTAAKDGSGGLTLLDENEQHRAYLSTDKDGTGLTLADENGKTRAALTAAEAVRSAFHSVKYIHTNPVKRGLVQWPQEWYYSSYRQMHGQGDGPVEINVSHFPRR